MMAVFNKQHKDSDIFTVNLGELVWAPTSSDVLFLLLALGKDSGSKKEKKSECVWHKFKGLTICP